MQGGALPAQHSSGQGAHLRLAIPLPGLGLGDEAGDILRFDHAAIGVLHDLTGGWDLVLVLLMATGVAMAVAGLKVSRPSLVDDELAPR